jgi:hypothetical protein
MAKTQYYQTKHQMTVSKDYFRDYVKEKSKNSRLSNDIMRMRAFYEKEIASLKNELICPRITFKAPFNAKMADNVSRLDLMNSVLQVCCEVGALTPGTLLGRTRDGDVVLVRHMFSYILRIHYHFTFAQIGMKLGRDHSSIIHAVNTFASWKAHDKHARAVYNKALGVLEITEDYGQSI